MAKLPKVTFNQLLTMYATSTLISCGVAVYYRYKLEKLGAMVLETLDPDGKLEKQMNEAQKK